CWQPSRWPTRAVILPRGRVRDIPQATAVTKTENEDRDGWGRGQGVRHSRGDRTPRWPLPKWQSPGSSRHAPEGRLFQARAALGCRAALISLEPRETRNRRPGQLQQIIRPTGCFLERPGFLT